MSGEYLGDFVGDETMVVVFDTFDSNGASVTMTGLATTDIEIYKGNSITQRASDAGFTLIDTDGTDIDAATGIHGFTVDLSDNTDAGFYATGNDYYIVVNAVTIDTQTVRFIAARFSIQNRYMRGTDSALLAASAPTNFGDLSITVTTGRVDVDSIGGTAQTANDNGADINAILVDTNSLNDGAIPELSQGVPSSTPTLQDAVMLLYMALRNQTIVQTAGADELQIGNDAGIVICKKALTDDGSDYTESKMVSGP